MKSPKRAFALLLMLALCGHALWAQLQVCKRTAENQSTCEETANTSIFDGTIVNATWPDVKKAVEENALVILPVAVIEQHGPHLCLGTDTYLAYRRSLELMQTLDSIGVRSIVAPPYYWGIMQLNESGAFPGSFTVSPSTMKALLSDIFADFHRWGFRRFYCFNHHGDRLHLKSLNEAITEAKEKLGIAFYNDRERQDSRNGPDFRKYVTGELFEPNYHSGSPETSLMLDYYPQLVNLEIAKSLKPESTWQPLGYVGDPAGYGKIDMPGYSKEEVKYIAGCIADWVKAGAGK